jgi:carbonic anhydrase/acetyltransferase-like protein (isoleucine patch superfamily)
LVLGSPAKVIRKITNTEEENIKKNALVYVEKALEYKKIFYKK